MALREVERIEYTEHWIVAEVDDETGGHSTRVEWKPQTREANEETLRDRMRAALAVNAAYLAIAAPTTLQQRAQIERLTRQTTTLLREALGELDTVDGT